MKNILMNKEMAKAILDDRKTQTRRAITKFYNIDCKEPKKCPIDFKDLPQDLEFKSIQGFEKNCALFYSKSKDKYYCSNHFKYHVGDKLWIREPAIVTNYISRYDSTKIDYQLKSDSTKEYRIDVPDRFFPNPKKWITECQSVPNGCIKEMAKTFLIITGVKVERLQDISIDDIIKEGCPIKTSPKDDINIIQPLQKLWWQNFWDNINKKRGFGWNKKPFVIIYEFKRIKK